MRSFAASAFDPGLSIDILMMVLIGSMSTLWGAVVGAFVITVLPNLLEGFEHYKLLVFGLAMVAVMVFFPNGLVQSIVDAFKAAVLRRSGSVATDDAERRAAP
jgi:branched-chain amino acid transport system permease protein